VAVAVQPGMQTNGDPGLMRAMLENLIGNAWKFTAKTDAARIDVGSELRDGLPCFYVRDNGAGFDMQYAHKLFQPFQRLHHTRDFDGTGIGLATVKKIIQRHGGTVWVDSTVNQGTTVYFAIGEPA
jgi:light-regulated signal transduction histidine kinase (bacteriophytochrome)